MYSALCISYYKRIFEFLTCLEPLILPKQDPIQDNKRSNNGASNFSLKIIFARTRSPTLTDHLLSGSFQTS